MTVCFVLVALGLGYWSIVRAPSLVTRQDNPRRVEAERRIRRGEIVDRYGRPLAISEPRAGGVWERVYPAPAAAPVVGYASIDHGTGGIEDAYNTALRGDRARSDLEALQAQLLHRYPQGVDIRLTIDIDLTRRASAALEGRRGAVVVFDVPSGALLAAVSQPTFDPNTLESDWPQLQLDTDNPMLNRATQGLYPPGVVFETLTLAAILEEGLATPTTVFTDELGVVLDVEPPISCPGDPPETQFTLAEAYTWPCSVLFARLGLELSGEQLADYATKLGIGRPVDLPLDVSSGQILERGVWTQLTAARTAMGRGEVLVTPLEMAWAMATIANDGLQMPPRLVLEVDGEPVAPTTAPRQALSPDTAQQIQHVMAQSYAVGQRQAALPQADLAGRAGTADSGLPGAPYHAWFVGFAPADQPQYAIAVIVEYGDAGWEVAAPVAIQTLSPP
jgi:peptidoglycan glycosyltransferase